MVTVATVKYDTRSEMLLFSVLCRCLECVQEIKSLQPQNYLKKLKNHPMLVVKAGEFWFGRQWDQVGLLLNTCGWIWKLLLQRKSGPNLNRCVRRLNCLEQPLISAFSYNNCKFEFFVFGDNKCVHPCFKICGKLIQICSPHTKICYTIV